MANDPRDPKNEERVYLIDRYGTGLPIHKKASLMPKLLQQLKDWGYRKNISPELGDIINRFETPTEPKSIRKEG